MKKFKEIIKLFFTMFKVGLFTFGGGYAMISLIRKEFVENKKWLTDEELMDMISISESTPGPIAINMATFIGYRLFKVFGAFAATLGVALPSYIIIVIISIFLQNIMSYEIVQHAFIGINCAVGVLIITAFTSLVKTMPKNIFSYILFGISCIITFIILFFNVKISTIYLLLFGGILSLIYYFIKIKVEVKDK